VQKAGDAGDVAQSLMISVFSGSIAAGGLMADLMNQTDVLTGDDIAETVAFLAALPRHVNLTEIHILPTEQII
jgi:NADP-dependent 3-hydroxy acid dehydrogenase YdfG